MLFRRRTTGFFLWGLILILTACTHPAKPITTQREQDGMVMVYVPGGAFDIGITQGQIDTLLGLCSESQNSDSFCENNIIAEAPFSQPVSLPPYWIDQTEITHQMFAAFLNLKGNQVEEGIPWYEPGAGHRGIVYSHILQDEEGRYSVEPGYESHPIIEVSWYGAAAYCAWVGARLPTEAEWAFAARGPDATLFPWGNTFQGANVNYCDSTCQQSWADTQQSDGFAEIAPVGQTNEGASWVGAYDLVGNVWEWVRDPWPEVIPGAGPLQMAVGGSWYEENYRVSALERKALQPSSFRMHWVGFRCAAEAEN